MADPLTNRMDLFTLCLDRHELVFQAGESVQTRLRVVGMVHQVLDVRVFHQSASDCKFESGASGVDKVRNLFRSGIAFSQQFDLFRHPARFDLCCRHRQKTVSVLTKVTGLLDQAFNVCFGVVRQVSSVYLWRRIKYAATTAASTARASPARARHLQQVAATAPAGAKNVNSESESSEEGSPSGLRAKVKELLKEKAERDAELTILKDTMQLTKEKGIAEDLSRKAAWVRQWDSVRIRVRTTLDEVKSELEGLDQCATEALLEKLNRDWQDSELSYNSLLPYADEPAFHLKLSKDRTALSDGCFAAKATIKRQLKKLQKEADEDKLDAEEQRYLNRLMGSGVKPVSPAPSAA